MSGDLVNAVFPHHVDDAGDWIVRPFVEQDRDAVTALSLAGLLPGYIGVDFRDLSEIGSRYIPERRSRFWIAEVNGEVVGMVAVGEVSRDVGEVRWMRVARPAVEQLRIAKRLLRVAAIFASEVGFLKLIVHVPAAAQSPVAGFLHSIGFEHARNSQKDGRDMMEFYLNFYDRRES